MSDLILPFKPPKKFGDHETHSEQHGTEEISKAKGLQMRASHLLAQQGFTPIGFATVFFYKTKNPDHPEIGFIVQAEVASVQETYLIKGMEKLTHHLMKLFGKEPPKKRF